MLSVVVATYKDPLGLYMTVYSLVGQLQHLASQFEWEIIIAADAGTEYKWEKLPNVRCMRIHGGSPQYTRDFGIRSAKYPTVLCVESHVVLDDIALWLQSHYDTKATLSFNKRIGETSELYTSYGYEMDWDRTFWNKKTIYLPPKALTPYPIVANGHAAFLIDRTFYIQHGGYFLEMQGWGGEEPDLNLLVWHMGGSVWMHPQSSHAHYLTAGAHASRTEDFARNFCIAAYEHGGKKYSNMVGNHFHYGFTVTPNIEKRRQLICQGKFNGNLDALRTYFKEQGITD